MKCLTVTILTFYALSSTVLSNPIEHYENQSLNFAHSFLESGLQQLFNVFSSIHNRQRRCILFCRVKRVHHDSDLSLDEHLLEAAAQGRETKMKIYIRRGANVNYVNANGDTPLIAAAYSGDHDAVDILISKRANVNYANNNGNTALITAAFHDNKKCVESLIKGGAYVNFQNIFGDTALHVAARAGHKKIVDLLESNGADLHIRNHDGQTAMDCAIESGTQNEGEQSSLLTNLKQAKEHLFSLGKKKVVDLLSRLGDDAQSKSVDTTNPPAVVQTTKYPIVIETTESSVFIQTTQPAVDTLTTNAPAAALTPTEAVRNACKSYTRFAESMPTPVVRILGGSPARSGEFPWMAALGYLNSELKVEFNCGGTLISDKFVLTAAHCVKQSLRLVLVRLGKLNLTDGADAVDRTIEGITTHPDYSSTLKLNDIALIRIKPVAFSRNVIPACLQTDEQDMPPNEMLVVTGWGSISAERTNKSSILLKTQLQTMSIDECSSKLLNRTSSLSGLRNITNGQYCAFDPHAQNDSCQGDSGGPLQVFTEHSTICNVVGIVSYGISCGTAMPAVYTRVAHYVDWIASHVWPNTIG